MGSPSGMLHLPWWNARASLSIYVLNCLDRTVALAVGYVDPKSTSRAWVDQLGYLVTATFLSTSMEVGVDEVATAGSEVATLFAL